MCVILCAKQIYSINIYKQNIYHAQGETLASLCHSVSQFHHLSQPPRPLKLCELETAMKACLMTYDVQDMHIHDLWLQFPPLILIFGPSNLDATLLDRPAMIPVLLCGMRNLAAICRPWHQGPTLASMQSSLNKMRQKKKEKNHFKHAKDAPPAEAPAKVRIALWSHCMSNRERQLVGAAPGKSTTISFHIFL